MLIIVSRRRETSRHTCMFKFKFGVEYTFNYLYVTHKSLIIFLSQPNHLYQDYDNRLLLLYVVTVLSLFLPSLL